MGEDYSFGEQSGMLNNTDHMMFLSSCSSFSSIVQPAIDYGIEDPQMRDKVAKFIKQEQGSPA